MKPSRFALIFSGLLAFAVLTSCAIGSEMRDPDTVASPPPPPMEPQQQLPGGVISPKTGEYLPPSGSGVINPRTGDYYFPSGNGYFNPKTGEFIPKKR